MYMHIAHELRAWILYYSAAVLYGILPETYYQHHLLLVEAIFLLLKEKIHSEDVTHSSDILNHYCFLFGKIMVSQSVNTS